MTKYIPGTIVLIALIAMLFYAVIDGLSAKNWYSDKHDSKCEKAASNTACKCYARFTKKAGEK